MLATIYHNPRCSKSRETLKILHSKGVSTKIILYLTDTIKRSELIVLLRKLNMTPIQFVRRNEQVYKELVSKQMQPTDDALIDAMIAYPILIERPIVVIENQAVIGRPPENVLSIIS